MGHLYNSNDKVLTELKFLPQVIPFFVLLIFFKSDLKLIYPLRGGCRNIKFSTYLLLQGSYICGSQGLNPT